MKNFNNHVQRLEAWCDGKIGVHAIHTKTYQILEYRAEEQFLLCSTDKIPMAICLLQKVEQGELSLQQMIEVHDYDLRPGIFSTLTLMNYAAPVHMSVLSLLQFMMQESCNSATDIILRSVGGPQVVDQMLRNIGVADLHVDRYGLEILADWDGIRHLIPDDHHVTLEQYKALEHSVSEQDLKEVRKRFKENQLDHGTPHAMSQVLLKLFNGELLNEEHTQLLLKIMQRCKTGPNRIMGLLPLHSKVSRKTGTLTGHVNDVGIIYLSDGAGEIIISVLVAFNQEKEVGERVIAEVARSVYDYFYFIV